MDEQNIMEKIGIVKELGDIKGTQIRMNEQLKNLIETSKMQHDDLMAMIREHHVDLNGPVPPGLKTQVDRLNQWKAMLIGTWVFFGPVTIKVVYDWVKH